MSEHVILLHGLWMRGFTLSALRRRIATAGFVVEPFDYASVFHDPEASIGRLQARVRDLSGTVHIVGHSLGGLIALQALQRSPEILRGRVVCLGAPLRGSAVARVVSRLPGGAFVIGKSRDILNNGITRWDGAQAVGAIAGRLPFGFGLALRALAAPHDGTVSVAETELPGLTDHVVVPATHTGLLFSQVAAEQTVAFLRRARFAHA